MRHPVAVLAILASAALPGCADNQPIANSSCRGDNGVCVDLVSASTASVADSVCQQYVGYGFIYADGATCPPAGIVGSCALAPSDASIILQYYAPQYAPDTAATDCGRLGGTFHAP